MVHSAKAAAPAAANICPNSMCQGSRPKYVCSAREITVAAKAITASTAMIHAAVGLRVMSLRSEPGIIILSRQVSCTREMRHGSLGSQPLLALDARWRSSAPHALGARPCRPVHGRLEGVCGQRGAGERDFRNLDLSPGTGFLSRGATRTDGR